MTIRSLFHAVTLGLLVPALAAAGQQPPADPTMRGVPAGEPTGTTIPISLADAIQRGLDHNLAIVLQEQRVRGSESAHLQALAALVPHVSASLRDSEQVINTAAFGFSGFGGLPSLIGPFNVFDARVALSTPIVDRAAWQDLRSQAAALDASHADLRQVRETVVLAVGNLYLMALADRARLDAADAQVTTAETLAQLAEDQLSSGLVPQIDVLRQQVQLQAARSRQIAASNSLAKRKLQLARAIGLPARQAFELSDSAAYKPMAAPTIDEAVAEASAHRPDVAGARARLEAARAARRAAASGALPTLDVDADVGALGPSASTAERTFTVAATVRMPIFEGGRTRANVREADARMKEREAELADLQGGLRYDISAALLDLQAAATAVDVASSARTLADQELTQAQDRFQAGVASSVELVQAQEAVARASEQYIDAVYGHMLAKAGLAQAMGELEQRFLTLVGGQP